MKSFSSNVVTPEQLASLEQSVNNQISDIDAAQGVAIDKLNKAVKWVAALVAVVSCTVAYMGYKIHDLKVEVATQKAAIVAIQQSQAPQLPVLEAK